MAQSPEVEILIHITAPSRAIDDSRYRSLASAYLDFEPETFVPISSVSYISSAAGTNQHEPQASRQQTSQDDGGRYDPQLSGQVRLLESPTASFRSVLDNANSPRPVMRKRAQHAQANQDTLQSQVTQSTWQSPPSMVEDSVPQNNVMATRFTSPTRVLEHYLQAFDSSPQAHTRSSGGSSEQIIVSTPVQRQRNDGNERNCHQKQSTTPIIPRTPFPAIPVQSGKYTDHQFAKNKHDTSHEVQGARFGSSQTGEEAIEETTLMSSPEIPPVGRADSEPLPGRKAQKMAAGSSPRQLSRTSSDVGPKTSGKRTATVVTINFLPSHGFKYESLGLHAPEPPVSISPIEPRGLITANLERLAKSLETEKRFRPKEQIRELRPTERGCWLLDCTNWSGELKRDCWAFLANYIGTGTAGWGVSCRRDIDFQWVRTYCWGTVVPHIYLLLYLATQREILFTGASWSDGDGETVIVMGTREHR